MCFRILHFFEIIKMNQNVVNIVKVVLAVFLFLCLIDFPYGYYQFVRFFGMVSFGFFAFWNFQNSNQTAGIIYIILALLFQPFVKIHLGRELWNLVDVIIGVGLFVTIYIDKAKPKKD